MNTLKVIHTGFGAGFKANNCSDWCPYKKRRGHRHTERHKEEGRVKTEADIGVRLPQAKKCLEPQDSGRGKGVFIPRALGGNMAFPTT